MEALKKMALKLAVSCLLFMLILGYFPSEASLTKDTPPPMTEPPLINYGDTYGDTQLKDLGTASIELPFNISFFGSSFKFLHISPDGVLSFDKKMDYIDGVKWAEGVRNPSVDQPFIAPFYYNGFRPNNIDPLQYQGKVYYRYYETARLDTSDKWYSEKKNLATYLGSYLPEAVINAPGMFKAELVVVVTWQEVAEKNPTSGDCTTSHKCPAATFQAVLVSDRENTFVIFNYLKMDIPFHSSYQAGFNGGFGRGWYNVIPCQGSCGLGSNVSTVNDLPHLKGSDEKGRFILNVGHELIVRGGCLPSDIKAGLLEVFPLEIGMFGGEKLQVSGQCQPSGSKIYCKFGDAPDSVITEGNMVNEVKGFCPVPMLTQIGTLKVSWSRNRVDWSSDNEITVVLPEKVDPSKGRWENIKAEWYKRSAETITVNWDSSAFIPSSDRNQNVLVEVKLYGYRETADKVEYQILERLGETQNSRGEWSFAVDSHRCKTDCDKFEIGLFEIALPSHFHADAGSRIAIRYGPFPLGWYVNKELEETRGSDWSDQKCNEWHGRDSQQEEWLKSLLPCPCSLDQALADFGRFQPDPGCNLYTGSRCHYHTEAKHCVRSFVNTKEGAGNQCCYDKGGHLIHSQLSFQGSTPDRSHVWGAAPYNKPDLVPSLSHWKHDVVSYYYCCLWNEFGLCDKYMRQRPTADCKKYEPPGLGFLRGDPHITTFDGQTYTFVGSGDFWLVKTEKLKIQGRFTSRPNSWDLGELAQVGSWKPKALTSVTLLNEEGAVPIEIHPAPERTNRPHGLDIRIGGTRKFFFNESTIWQDFKGQSVVNNVLPGQSNNHDNFTILMSNQAGVNIVGINGLLHITVALPPTMKLAQNQGHGQGLFGTFDENNFNDFTSSSGAVSSPGTPKDKLFQDFALSWEVKEGDSLFQFNKLAERLDQLHPYFELKDIPFQFVGAPSQGDVSRLCSDNVHCQWDYRITGDSRVAQATRDADVTFGNIKSSAYRVENCGLPEIGEQAELNAYNFSIGHKVTVTGCKEGREFVGESTFTCTREKLEEAKEAERADYGEIRKDQKENVEYIVHWVPRPFTVCSGEPSEADIGLIIGISVAAAVVILIIIVIVILVVKKGKCRRSKSAKIEKPKPAERRGKEVIRDPTAAEAMLDEVDSRSPVYKPSKASSVRMSDIKSGTNV
ncbi:unnamed protein product [Lymnaea stagnalis]|uniref:Uncharacterized protein n=1 Tax=Lymnaea stagnalis TaxID=6523 RepID=A0AAV2IFV4_LYMST